MERPAKIISGAPMKSPYKAAKMPVDGLCSWPTPLRSVPSTCVKSAVRSFLLMARISPTLALAKNSFAQKIPQGLLLDTHNTSGILTPATEFHSLAGLRKVRLGGGRPRRAAVAAALLMHTT